jgi:hypothetical protein
MRGGRENGIQAHDLHIVVESNGSVRELFGRRMDLTPSGSKVIEGGRRKNKRKQLRYTPKK